MLERLWSSRSYRIDNIMMLVGICFKSNEFWDLIGVGLVVWTFGMIFLGIVIILLGLNIVVKIMMF
ncbi:hypothetical protein [Candidatus Hodgkinia cicadicola]|uniref:hypothetical protein n=1 Tax=Candidatus Hodgkinia cicadicola TaxID=573658 RepID=UPI0011BAC8D8